MTRLSPHLGRGVVPLALVLTMLAAQTAASVVQASTLAKSMPAGALIYGEGVGLTRIIDRVRSAVLFEPLIASRAFKIFANSPYFRRAEAARKIVETQMGLDFGVLVEGLFGGRIALGIYPAEAGNNPELLALLRVADGKVLARVRERLDPFWVLAGGLVDRSKPEAGTDLLEFEGRAFVGLGKDWILVSSSRALLVRAIGIAAGGTERTLAEAPGFVERGEPHRADPLVRVRVNMELIRKKVGGRFVPKKLDNPLASFLFGGMVELAAQCPYAELHVDLEDDALVLFASLRTDSRKLDPAHRAFFSDPASAGSAPIPDLPTRIGGITIYRDLGTWYRQREDLLLPAALPGYDRFESSLANLLPGKDVGADVLPLLGSRFRLVSAPQDYAHLEGRPGVELPGFGLLVELRDPVQGARMFRLFFQTISALLNLQAGAQGREPWVMGSQTYAGVQIAFGEYLQKPAGDHLDLVFNFMPAAARVGGTFIVCTSLDLCRQLVDALQKPNAEATKNRNLYFEIRGEPLADILSANRDSLSSEGIRSGKSREEVEEQLELILRVVRSFDCARLSTVVEAESFGAKLELRW